MEWVKNVENQLTHLLSNLTQKKVRFRLKKVALKFSLFTKNSYFCTVVRKRHQATKFAA